jgi:hypothetical protein
MQPRRVGGHGPYGHAAQMTSACVREKGGGGARGVPLRGHLSDLTSSHLTAPASSGRQILAGRPEVYATKPLKALRTALHALTNSKALEAAGKSLAGRVSDALRDGRWDDALQALHVRAPPSPPLSVSLSPFRGFVGRGCARMRERHRDGKGRAGEQAGERTHLHAWPFSSEVSGLAGRVVSTRPAEYRSRGVPPAAARSIHSRFRQADKAVWRRCRRPRS